MASELLKNRALIQKLKEPEVSRVKFNLASTGFEELFTLPEPKPQELLDIQEDNRKGRLLESLNKIGGGLMNESVDFIRRENFSTAGLVTKLLSKIPVRTGAERVEKITDFTAQKKFMNAFLEYANKKFNGNFSAAADSIGQNRNKIRAIFDRVREAETGTRKGGIGIGKGAQKVNTVPTPKNLIPYTDATTKVKTDKNFLKDKINDSNKNKFYSATDIANILGVDVSNKAVLDNLTADLKRFGVVNKSTSGQMKSFKLGDAVNKITKGYEKKLVKGQRDSQTKRLKIDARLDPDLKNFLENFKQATRKISKEEDIFVPGAIEDIGHPLSVKITDKYPKLTKNSNINKINTLTFQDPQINREILEKTGYETKHDSLLKSLNKLVGKKIGPKELEELKLIKSQMNALHNKALTDIKKLAQENTYLKGQENRVPKIDINLPKQGQTFKSEDLFVDMSNVNPAFKVGLVDQINPNAKFFKNLNTEQKEIYKRNVLDQTKFNLDKFYSKAGFPKEQVDELKDSLEFGTASKLGIGTVGTLGLGSTAAAADEGDGNFISTKDIDGNLMAMELPKTDAETLDEFAEEETNLAGDIGAGAGLTTGATIGSKATKADLLKGVRRFGKKGAMNLLKILGTPAGIAAYEAGLIPGFEGGVADRLKEGDSAEDVFLRSPTTYAGLPLATLGQEFLKTRPALQRILNLGLSPKLVRMGTPVGIGLMGLTALADSALKFQEEFDALSPEEQKQYLKEQEEFGEDVQGAAEGGRIGFADGPDDPSKRKFMKLMGILSLLPYGIGKLVKPAAPVIQKLANTTTKMPDWFPNFVDRFINKGIGNKIDADLMEYTVKELPDVKLLKQDNGAIRVEGKNAYNEEYYIDYEPPGVEVVDYNTGKTVKTKGDFVATDTEYRMISPEDYDVDGVNVDEIDDILGGSSTKLEGFAKGTNKEKYTIGQKRIDEADARGASKDESLRADINDPYGDVDPTDFADD